MCAAPICAPPAGPPLIEGLEETRAYVAALWQGGRLEQLTRLWLAGVDVCAVLPAHPGPGRRRAARHRAAAPPAGAGPRHGRSTAVTTRPAPPATLAPPSSPPPSPGPPRFWCGGLVKLWLCPNDGLPPEVAGLLATHWLDAREQKTASRFLFERDRRQYLLAHTLVRRALALEAGLAEAELVIWRSARGRPFLRPAAAGGPRGGSQLDFNLSHAGGYSLLGMVRRHRIGVDVERLEDRDERAITTIVRTFAAPEREWVAQAGRGPARDRRALRVWTLKEAYSKARGLGLGLPFDAFAFTLDDERGVRAFTPPGRRHGPPVAVRQLEPVPDVLVPSPSPPTRPRTRSCTSATASPGAARHCAASRCPARWADIPQRSPHKTRRRRSGRSNGRRPRRTSCRKTPAGAVAGRRNDVSCGERGKSGLTEMICRSCHVGRHRLSDPEKQRHDAVHRRGLT